MKCRREEVKKGKGLSSIAPTILGIMGGKAQGHGVCPAYPDHGTKCARISGTMCGGEVQGTFAMKLVTCMTCDFYDSEHYIK